MYEWEKDLKYMGYIFTGSGKMAANVLFKRVKKNV